MQPLKLARILTVSREMERHPTIVSSKKHDPEEINQRNKKAIEKMTGHVFENAEQAKEYLLQARLVATQCTD